MVSNNYKQKIQYEERNKSKKRKKKINLNSYRGLQEIVKKIADLYNIYEIAANE